ncbi:hypothetical protein Nepgr_019506 [Nepenthes gracilis]|uniref:Uncharacterized protein n=1 Tax=Nepenthes gracilis TaxID=150966 RepID=A0AAD3SV82_NEPGR|nr:hypothetical protein Nepgr_019506 [Nepenthes gracilis]
MEEWTAERKNGCEEVEGLYSYFVEVLEIWGIFTLVFSAFSQTRKDDPRDERERGRKTVWRSEKSASFLRSERRWRSEAGPRRLAGQRRREEEFSKETMLMDRLRRTTRFSGA